MLLGLYLGCLALGGVLIGASVLLGGHDVGHDADHDADHDVGHDADHDVGHDADHDADHGAGTALAEATAHPLLGGGLPFLSLRFWTFGLASFGATGALLALTVLPGPVSLAVAVPTGLAIGTAVTALFRALKRHATGRISSATSLAGREALVLLEIRPGALGKIRIAVDGPDVDLLARTGEPEPIPRGARVLVITVRDGAAEVIPLPGSSLES